MKVFKHLEDDSANIEERLTKTEDNADGPVDRAFAEVKNEFAMIKAHLAKVSLLIQNLKDRSEIGYLIQDLADKEMAVKDDINTMLNLHIDEPGFEKPFDQLVLDFQDYRQFCNQSFFPSVQEQLTEEDLKHVEEQLDQVALS